MNLDYVLAKSLLANVYNDGVEYVKAKESIIHILLVWLFAIKMLIDGNDKPMIAKLQY